MTNTSEAKNINPQETDTDKNEQLTLDRFSINKASPQHFQQRLNFTLQRTLDLKTQLRIYHLALAKRFGVESLSYDYKPENITLDIGQPCHHHCQYDLIADQEFIGHITLTRTERFLPEELLAIERSTISLAYPLRNALQFHRAVQSALTDPLTGAGNRLALDETLTQEMESFRRYNRPFSVGLIDLDHFKRVNDNYGHDAGDTVLRTITARIKENCRATDRFFRYGGEEFVLVMSSTDSEGAIINTERLRALIAGTPCIANGSEIPITMSVGVATAQTDDTPRLLLSRADHALYHAKTQGRNRVVNAEDIKATSHS